MKWTLACIALIALAAAATAVRVEIVDAAPESDGTLCSVCELVASTLETEIQKFNVTAQEVAAAVNDLCSILPASLQPECQEVQGLLNSTVIEGLLDGASAATLCADLTLCTSDAAVVPEPMPQFDVICDLCDLFVEEAVKALQNNETEATILADLAKACDLLPSADQGKCNLFVKISAPLLIDELKDGSDPEKLCSKIPACNSTEIATVTPVKPLTLKPVGSDVECLLCETVVGKVQAELSNNQTLNEIVTELEKLCSILGSLQEECDIIITGYVPQIVDTLVDGGSPDTICEEIGLCSNSTAAAVVEAFALALAQPEPVLDVECTLCQIVVGKIEQYVQTNSSISEIEDELQKVCNALGPIASACNSIVDQYVPVLIEKVINGESADAVCADVGLCSNSSAILVKAMTQALLALDAKAPKTPVTFDLECDVCSIVITKVEDLLKNNNTEAAIIDELDKLCGLLPAAIGATCKGIVDTEGPEIITNIIEGQNPQTLCAKIGLCPNTTALAKPTPVAKLAAPKAPVFAIECTLCTIVVGKIESYLETNSSLSEIEDELEKVCNALGPIAKECNAIVTEYVPIMVEKVINGESSEDVCADIGLCSNSSAIVTQAMAKAFLALEKKAAAPKPTPVVFSIECDLCTIVVSKVEELLSGNSTESAIIDELDKLCGLLPGAIGTECKSIVDANAPSIISKLVNGESPDTVCDDLKLCTSSKTVAPQASGELCTLCQLVAGAALNYLENNTTETAIVDELEKLCGILPGAVGSECSQLVASNGEEIISRLVGGASASSVCDAVSLCSDNVTMRAALKPADTECSLCTLVLTAAQSLLENNATDTKLEDTLDKVCNLLPSSLPTTCDNIVAQVTPEVLEYLDNQGSPAQICGQIALCPPSTPLFAPAASEEVCDVCTWIGEQIIDAAAGNSTLAEVEKLADGACSLLPSAFSNTCEGFANTLLADLQERIVQDANPQTWCADLGVCASAKKAVPAPARRPITVA